MTDAIQPARRLLSMESRPNSGPMVRFSTTSTGTGSAPPRSSTARVRASVRSWNPPLICPRPPVMVVRITGEEITSLSRTMVRY